MPDAQPAPVGGSLPHPGSREQEPRTVEAYNDAVRLLALYCEAHGKPLLTRQLQREHLQDFIADQLARWKPAAAHNRYRSLHAFSTWAVAEGDLQASPIDGMKRANLPEQPVGVIRAEQLVRVLKTCEGRTSPAGVTPPSSCWLSPACAASSASA